MSAGRARTVVGFVVKVEYFEEDALTKTRTKHRREVSRVYHSRDAAEVCKEMFQKQNPERHYYVHEKGTQDNALIY